MNYIQIPKTGLEFNFYFTFLFLTGSTSMKSALGAKKKNHYQVSRAIKGHPIFTFTSVRHPISRIISGVWKKNSFQDNNSDLSLDGNYESEERGYLQ